jgi:hypothetical protein
MTSQTSQLRPLFTAIAAAVALVVTPSPADAGPWVETPGNGYLKLSGEYFASQGTFDLEGRANEMPPLYSHVGARSYGEVGVAPRVSIGWSLPVVRATNTFGDGGTRQRTGLGDFDARVDIQLFRGACAGAAELEARMPLYSGTVGVGDRATATSGDGDSRAEPVLGDGSREFAAGLAVGCGFALPGWVSASVGPRFRFDGFADGLDWSVDAGGYIVPDRFAVKLAASGRERFATNAPRPTKRYVKASGGLLLGLGERFALEGTAGYTLDGAFVARGWSGALGVSYEGRLFPNPYEDS